MPWSSVIYTRLQQSRKASWRNGTERSGTPGGGSEGARGYEMGQEAAEAVGKTSSDIARQSGQASKRFLRGVASPWHPLQFCSELSASAPAASRACLWSGF